MFEVVGVFFGFPGGKGVMGEGGCVWMRQPLNGGGEGATAAATEQAHGIVPSMYGEYQPCPGLPPSPDMAKAHQGWMGPPDSRLTWTSADGRKPVPPPS